MSDRIPAPAAERMKQHARQEFDAWAHSYDRSLLHYFLFRPSYLNSIEEVARWRVERAANRVRVLDIGCGTGTFASILGTAPWQIDVVGLDYSAEMCARAQHKNRSDPPSSLLGTSSDEEVSGTGVEPAHSPRRVRFVNADSEALPFADGSFEVVTCSNSFHHYPHQQAVVREMHRVLSPGGRLIIIDGFRDCVIGWVVFDVIIGRIEKSVYHAPWQVMDRYFQNAGFTNIRRRKFNLLFPAFVTTGDR